MIKAGSTAPQLELSLPSGEKVDPSHPEKPLVLFFFPKAFSRICTAEMCELRDRILEFEALGALAIGISRDSQETEDKFREKHGLTFPVVGDPDGSITAAFGVGMLGGLIPASSRVTFVIDQKGKIRGTCSSLGGASVHVRRALEILAETAHLQEEK